MKDTEFIPSDFYYALKESSPSYSDSPPGKFNLNQFLLGEPYWELEQQNIEKRQPKILILNDTNIPRLNDLTCLMLLEYYTYLIHHDFSIYIYEDKKLVLLNEHNIHMLLQRQDILFSDLTEIELLDMVEKKLNINREKIYILNNNSTNDILIKMQAPDTNDSKKTYTSTALHTADLYQLNPAINTLELNDITLVGKFDSHSEQKLNNILSLEIKNPKITQKELLTIINACKYLKILSISMNNSDIKFNHFYEKIKPKFIRILKLNCCQGDTDNLFNFINQLKFIKDIEWYMDENETYFINNKELLTSPSLRNFSYITDTIADSEEEIHDQFELPHLKLYNLNLTNINALANIAGQIQFYYNPKGALEKFKTDGSVLYTLAGERPLTETLYVKNEFLTQIIELLNDFRNITSLHLDSIHPNETPELESSDLKNLKELFISNSTISEFAIKKIVGQSQHVKIHQEKNITKSKEKFTYLDADTRHNENKTINIDKIFFVAHSSYEIHPNYYRLNIIEKSECNPSPCNINTAFILKKYDNLELIPKPIIRSDVDLYQKMLMLNDNDIAYGKQTLELTSNEWHPIASSSPHDEMLEFHAAPNNSTIEIHYSNTENRYYIRASKSIELKLDFIIKRHLDRQVKLIENNYISEFKREPLRLNPGQAYTGYNYLHEIILQKTGACRHRAIVFNQTNQNLNRIIFNKSHMFIELWLNNRWVTLDLGGYPTETNINSNTPNIDQATIDGHTNTLREINKPKNKNEYYVFDFKKILIECNNAAETISCYLFLEKDCLENQRPVFYVSKPSDLNCRSPWMKNNHGKGELHTEPGGLFFDFIHTTHTIAPVIIINLQNFKLNEIVKFNTMLDNARKIDGFNIPENTIIIALNNTSNPECYRGVDFTSRFDIVLSNPFANKSADIFNIPITPRNINKPYFIINLFNSHNWKNQLIGQWIVNEKAFYYKPGKLMEAIQSGLPIEIQNGLWEDDEFNLFIKQALLRGYIAHHGTRIEINKHATFSISSNHKKYPFATFQGFAPNAPTLNRTQFPLFFEQYAFDSNNKLIATKPGIIELHQNSTLKVNYTHPISDHLLHKLHDECEKFNVILDYHLAHYNNPLTVSNQIHQLPTLMIDISECKATELLSKITMKINTMTNHLEFEESEKFLLKAKNKRIHIILKGTFSPELSETLAPFLLDYLTQTTPYAISIITEDANHLDYLPNAMISIIPKNNSLPPELSSLKPIISTLNASDLTLHRTRLVDNALKDQPIVFIAGVTGTGKTHFIQHEYLKNKSNDKLFIGDSKKLEWAQNKTSAHRKILFIDEGNIEKRDWSEFEGLYHNPPHIIIDGDYYELDNNHQVIFAGNPANYGDRKVPQLFINHPNIIVFDILSNNFIKEIIIKPILPWDEISKPILDVYEMICHRTINEVLISPRELQTMAKLVISAYNADPSINLLNTATYYAHLIGNQIIPNLFENNEKFQSPHFTPVTNYNYLLTESRLPLWQLISDLLAQRLLPGGLGGIVINGESGIGKSELVSEILFSKSKTENLIFYHLPVSMDYDQKTILLLKAFHEGAVVIIDEINASPMMERLLNNLLMGQTPEGEKAKQPGFIVIGTQNPTYYAGRFNPSTALSRRLLTVDLLPYSQIEIQSILEHKKIDTHQAKLIAAAYMQTKPTPTLRDVFKLVEQKGISKKRKADYQSWMLLFNVLKVDPKDLKHHKYSVDNKNGP